MGKVLEVTFKTKAGVGRYEKCRTYTDELQSKLGYMRFETLDGRKISVNPLNTIALSIGRQTYKVIGA